MHDAGKAGQDFARWQGVRVIFSCFLGNLFCFRHHRWTSFHALWTRSSNLHAFHFADQTLRRCYRPPSACRIHRYATPLPLFCSWINLDGCWIFSGADFTYKELLDKRCTQNVANNINYRHRMAQYASRASVNLHTHLFFRNQVRKTGSGVDIQAFKLNFSICTLRWGTRSGSFCTSAKTPSR